MSSRKKPSKEEPLTAEESQKLKSLLNRALEPAASAGKQAGKEEESLTEEEVKKLDELIGPPDWKQIQIYRKGVRKIAKRSAIDQIIEALPEGLDPAEAYSRAAPFYASFLPSDGTELALSQLTVAATNAAMDCFARANTEDAPGRELELNYAAKLSVVAAGLTRALDQHRGPDRPEFIDDTLPPRRPTNADILKAAQSKRKDAGEKDASDKGNGEKGNGEKHDGDPPKPKDKSRPKEKEPSSSSA